jgi:filamentous hemagglutinin family protein
MRPRLSRLLLTTTALLTAALIAAAPVAGGPEGGTVVGGAATISGQGSSAVIVNQSSSSAIINWNTFNVGKGESVLFNQPSSSAVVLNRVIGGLGPSEILGTITANGRVFVINRDGVLFGPGAVINTAGFLASTNDIKNSDFMAGRYNFNIPGRPDASIVNQGTITASSGGFAALVAPGVRNSGTISATLGTVALAAGNSFTLDLYGDRLITLAVNDQIAGKVIDVATGQPLKSLITNDGKIKANGGRVELTAAAARHVVDSVINTSGVIKANSIGKHNGMILLSAATGGSKPTGAPAQTIRISGTLSAAGKRKGSTGGTILVTGEDIKFVGALVDVSGRAGGGKVLIGGDWAGGKPDTSLVANASAKLENYLIPTATTVSVDAATTIDASAKDSGNGGKVILWSDQKTTFAGTILARGGEQSGNGGFVETSGHALLDFSGNVDTRAPHGLAGTLLLDPSNLYINTAGTAPDADPNASAISVATVQNQLANGNVVLATSAAGNQAGDITIANALTWSGTTSLTLSAFHDININASITNTSAAGAPIILRADNTGTGVGTINFTGDPSISTKGPVSFYYNPSSYTNPQDSFFSGYVSGGATLTAYMLVNSVSDFGRVATNLAGTYALGRNIDLTGFQGFAPGTTFTGTFDGNGGVGQSYTMANFSLSSDSTSLGLFPIIGATGIIRNVALTNVNVSLLDPDTSGTINVGTLAGANYGTILNSSSDGKVEGITATGVNVGGLVGLNASSGVITGSWSSATANSGSYVGGLVGFNSGMITHSHASGAVGSVANVASVIGAYGGLVGRNDDLGTITASFATGSINLVGPTFGYLDGGGLVGQNHGNIFSSYATGAVQSTHSSQSHTYLGGLIGWNLSGSVEDSYATGNVAGMGRFGDGGGFVGVMDGGRILRSYATGTVNMNGSSSTAGGFVGVNRSTIEQSFATGAATGSAGALVGGFAGTNSGSIVQAYATGAVAGGANSKIGGLAGQNTGTIDQTYSNGPVSGGAESTIGGLVGAGNKSLVTNSYWDVQTSGAATSPGGGIGLTTAQLTSGLPTGFDASVWAANQTYPFFGWQPGQPPTPPESVILPDVPPPALVITNLILTTNQIFNPGNTPPVVTNIQNAIQLPPQLAAFTPPGGGSVQPPPPPLPRIVDIPPLSETRFIADELVIQVDVGIGVAGVMEAIRQLGLTLIASEQLGSTTNQIVLHLRITDGRSVRDVLQQLAAISIIGVMQPNYVYTTGQETAADPATPASRGDTGRQQGDAAQYILQKLRLNDVHRLVRGTNVPIAVIDSEIDASHPDLQGVITQRFSAIGAPERAHSHGTGMAGAIASRQRLIGTAPSAHLLAVHAFSTKAANAESTTFAILKGIDWSASQGARIINMSFAGPKDPSLERALKAAYDKGIVLIAAAGNAGPKSPPLYPGADPSVIAVTATDADDKIFSGANRGNYVAVAAPGVDILVPAPDNGYQLTTGTSVAAAEVSGVVALLLERNPRLTPADVRRILTTSARRLGSGDRNDDFGSGLVDPLRALQSAEPRTVAAPPRR